MTKIEIVTPQFHREKGAPSPHPAPVPFASINDRSYEELRSLGCRAWDEPDSKGRVLMLFPGEWYRDIPAGHRVVDINGHTESFVPGETDDDIRFGYLAYGVLVARGKSEAKPRTPAWDLNIIRAWLDDNGDLPRDVIRRLLAERDRLDRILREVTARAMGIPEPRTFTGTIDFIERGDQDTRTGGLAAEVAELRRHVDAVAAAREEGRRAGIEQAARILDADGSRRLAAQLREIITTPPKG